MVLRIPRNWTGINGRRHSVKNTSSKCFARARLFFPGTAKPDTLAAVSSLRRRHFFSHGPGERGGRGRFFWASRPEKREKKRDRPRRALSRRPIKTAWSVTETLFFAGINDRRRPGRVKRTAEFFRLFFPRSFSRFFPPRETRGLARRCSRFPETVLIREISPGIFNPSQLGPLAGNTRRFPTRRGGCLLKLSRSSGVLFAEEKSFILIHVSSEVDVER